MSLARLALRLAACEALNPYAVVASGPWPTIAEDRVYDSRVDLIQEDAQLDAMEGNPLLIVYTEEDISSPYGTAKYPPDEQVVHLVIEAMIASRGTVTIKKDDGTPETFGTIGAPLTDREREAMLDVLEAQVRRVVDLRARAAGSSILQDVAMEVHRIESFPQRGGDRVIRIAARTIKFMIKVKKEVWQPLPGPVPACAFDALPSPLSTVAKRLDPASTGGELCQSLLLQMLGTQHTDEAIPFAGIVVRTPAGGPRSMNEPITTVFRSKSVVRPNP